MIPSWHEVRLKSCGQCQSTFYQYLREVVQFFLHEEAGGPGFAVDADHGGMRAVGGAKGVINVNVRVRRKRFSEGGDVVGRRLRLVAVGVDLGGEPKQGS